MVHALLRTREGSFFSLKKKKKKVPRLHFANQGVQCYSSGLVSVLAASET